MEHVHPSWPLEMIRDRARLLGQRRSSAIAELTEVSGAWSLAAHLSAARVPSTPHPSSCEGARSKNAGSDRPGTVDAGAVRCDPEWFDLEPEDDDRALMTVATLAAYPDATDRERRSEPVGVAETAWASSEEMTLDEMVLAFASSQGWIPGRTCEGASEGASAGSSAGRQPAETPRAQRPLPRRMTARRAAPPIRTLAEAEHRAGELRTEIHELEDRIAVLNRHVSRRERKETGEQLERIRAILEGRIPDRREVVRGFDIDAFVRANRESLLAARKLAAGRGEIFPDRNRDFLELPRPIRERLLRKIAVLGVTGIKR